MVFNFSPIWDFLMSAFFGKYAVRDLYEFVV